MAWTGVIPVCDRIFSNFSLYFVSSWTKFQVVRVTRSIALRDQVFFFITIHILSIFYRMLSLMKWKVGTWKETPLHTSSVFVVVCHLYRLSLQTGPSDFNWNRDGFFGRILNNDRFLLISHSVSAFLLMVWLVDSAPLWPPALDFRRRRWCNKTKQEIGR